MTWRLEELVVIPKLQELTDHLHLAVGVPISIIGPEGEILTSSGWQHICEDFHRRHPEIEKACIAGNVATRKRRMNGDPLALYTCPRGLTDAAIPILIEGEHLGGAFAGQIFLGPPGESVEQSFRETARHFKLDEEAYMAAFAEIPVVSPERFRAILMFLSKLAEMIAQMGLIRKRELEADRKSTRLNSSHT